MPLLGRFGALACAAVVVLAFDSDFDFDAAVAGGGVVGSNGVKTPIMF